MGKFEKDLDKLVSRLCKDDENILREMVILRDHLIALYRRNLVKINHSVMELVCAKHLILSGYSVEVEKTLNNISCDIFGQKGMGRLIVEVETGFVPPEHALDPTTYINARITSKITRYSGYADKFALAIPPHYVMPIHPIFLRPPRHRREEEIRQAKDLCDLYYSNPPVTLEEIRNARLHSIYVVDVDSGTVRETDPLTYSERFRDMFGLEK
ncbi:MAG: hypothetical protein RMJ07_03865 [Nitrososphaerota archaeon]|nr:hypothetical protein [Candidatus Bathyarchaeota archaeon]MDW8048800.1 hypothetical protein [Nitrososphaerota archaeon]